MYTSNTFLFDRPSSGRENPGKHCREDQEKDGDGVQRGEQRPGGGDPLHLRGAGGGPDAGAGAGRGQGAPPKVLLSVQHLICYPCF